MANATSSAAIARIKMLEKQRRAQQLRDEARTLTKEAERLEKESAQAARLMLAHSGYAFAAGI